MFGYKLTKDDKTICIGVADNLTDALQRAPGGKYRVLMDEENPKGKRCVTYESVGPRDDVYIDIMDVASPPVWRMKIIHDTTDIIDIIFDEVKQIWND